MDDSVNKLNEDIRELKVRYFDYLRDLSRLNRTELDNAGYRGQTNAQAVKMALDDGAANIERKIRNWEREHPD